MKWALIAGVNGGIGRATVERLLGQNVPVIGLDRTLEVPEGLLDYHQVDLGNRQQVEAVLRDISGPRGNPTYVVLAMGTYLRKSLDDYSYEEARATFADNFWSAFLVLKMLMPKLRNAGGARVVCVGSQASVTGGLDIPYAASKAALTAMIKSLAREYAGDGLRFNCVNPGPVDTPMADAMGDERRKFYEERIPIGRFVTADEVAEAIVWLLTSDGNGINGAAIDIDGGLVRR